MSLRSSIRRLTVGAVALGTAATIGLAVPAAASPAVSTGGATSSRFFSLSRPYHGSGAAYVLTNDPTHNSVTVFARGRDGRLTQTGTVRTSGRGGSQVDAVVDPLASQGALTYDPAHRLLYAVNAGSDSLSVFSARGTDLRLLQVLDTRGHFPTSVAVAGDLVYVLDAGGTGAVTGFHVTGGRLHAITGSTRTLGLSNATVPQFLASPSQVAISPDRAHLIVSTKSGGTLQVFGLDRAGRPSSAAHVTTSAAAVPFALTFDAAGRLQVAAASGSASTYRVEPGGALTLVSGPVANGQAATCWSVRIGQYLYTANAGSNSITGYRIAHDGTLTLLDATGVTAHTDAGPVDLAASPDGRFLYQEATGAGIIDEYAVNPDGSLTSIGTVAGLPADSGSGIEGIATS
jgi:6-phosphogluconolactonase (cycloisomerase 2 family)